MKINLGRFAHDCLPTVFQLAHRHIPSNGLCGTCGREEAVKHCLLTCQFAKEVWRRIKVKFSINFDRKSFINPKTWLFGFLSPPSIEFQRMVFAVGT
jgi:hypothetical protein